MGCDWKETVDIGSTEKADIIIRKLFNHAEQAVAPSLSVFYDLRSDGTFVPFEPGTVIEGETPFLLEVDARNPIDVVQVWIGHRDLNDKDYSSGDKTRYEFLIDPQSFEEGVGETELIIDAYDIQGNWVEMRIPFFVHASGPAGPPPPRVTNVNLMAVTYGADIGLFRQQRASAFEQLGMVGDPDTVIHHDGTVIDIASLRQDATLYVVVKWQATPSANGYEIQRAWSATGPWQTIARVPSLRFGGEDNPYVDTSADLYPGRETFYRLRAVGPNGELGEWSTPVSVTPLRRFQVRLLEPAHRATGVSLNPVFRWEYDDVGAQDYIFTGMVLAATLAQPFYTWVFEDLNITEAPFNYNGTATEPLKPAKSYSWNIFEAEARAYYGRNSQAVAVSGENVGAVNGEFIFTTGYDD